MRMTTKSLTKFNNWKEKHYQYGLVCSHNQWRKFEQLFVEGSQMFIYTYLSLLQTPLFRTIYCRNLCNVVHFHTSNYCTTCFNHQVIFSRKKIIVCFIFILKMVIKIRDMMWIHFFGLREYTLVHSLYWMFE